MTRGIVQSYGRIMAIAEHIIAQQTLPGAGKRICVDEPTYLRIIITALEIIQPGFSIVDVATVAQRVHLPQGIRHTSGDGKDVTPCIVGILHDSSSAGVQDGDNITLQILHIVIDGIIECNRIISEVQRIAADCHLHQGTAVVEVLIGSGTVSPLGSQTIGIIGIIPGCRTVACAYQLSAMLPAKCPPGAVIVAGGVANAVVSNTLAIVGRQQVAPGSIVAIIYGVDCRTYCSCGVGILLPGQDISGIIMCSNAVTFMASRVTYQLLVSNHSDTSIKLLNNPRIHRIHISEQIFYTLSNPLL